MKQVLQDLGNGETLLIDAPAPLVSDKTLTINTRKSLISSGTERSLLEFGKASFIGKAKQQPEKVKSVFQKLKVDGFATTLDAVKSKLNQPIPLGYCNVGVVAELGKDITGLKLGDRVVSNGPHADIVKVPQNLCAKIPDEVDDETASFVVLASIALQGIRLIKPSLGEKFAVIGAGLIGLLTIQLLREQGCQVLAVDFDEAKLEIAKSFGAMTCNIEKDENPIATSLKFTNGYGLDGSIVTAQTKSSEPISQAARMCRKRGRIILVGVTGLEFDRSDFYEKELTFQVSCSYGPGRYDTNYEQNGIDYPYGYVRWTEQRNFQAILDLMAMGKIQVKPLISNKFEFRNVLDAYSLLGSDPNVLGILLNYGHADEERNVREIFHADDFSFKEARPVLGVVGAGNYATRILIPAFKSAGAQMHTLVNTSGTNSAVYGRKLGFVKSATDTQTLMSDTLINTIVIATKHDSHADYVIEALNNNKNVFVEKPLALELSSLEKIENAFRSVCKKSGTAPQLMVGFNRRFSPHIQKIKDLISRVNSTKTFVMTINAGEVSSDHWIQDRSVGGGRILGEACHFVDLMRFLAGCKITAFSAHKVDSQNDRQAISDTASITLNFEDGSMGTILYLSKGAPDFPKERIEIFASGGVLQLDNFRKLKGFSWPGFKKFNLYKQDKGQLNCTRAFVDAITSGKQAIPVSQIFEVSRVIIEISNLLNKK